MKFLQGKWLSVQSPVTPSGKPAGSHGNTTMIKRFRFKLGDMDISVEIKSARPYRPGVDDGFRVDLSADPSSTPVGRSPYISRKEFLSRKES